MPSCLWPDQTGATCGAGSTQCNTSSGCRPVLRSEYVARLTSMNMGTNGQAHQGAAPHVKVENGATYTVVSRSHPNPGQQSYYWLGDNGREIELTEQETADLL